MLRKSLATAPACVFRGLIPATAADAAAPSVLHPESFRHYVDGFNAGDEELYPGAIRNADAWSFLRDNDAGDGRFAVEKHGARSALALAAAVFRSGQSQIFAQHLQ